mmetsp:Transcript_38530/g.61074  ORF Transcript_38530/g.61074 Transcript_38530/m.61074 type:complete len:130 (-) Transcript_38530:174-563(-)|eukprot:CAMPEP_0201516578 /NCGR_PEP_ID=MMETSP0161_2-20130828/7879_1 /ASSEMBLY_ACC=CAM_ASM_000251 /TAXON_ID=180227 /ORGANISM="Neoparamoeba aestuarina, Strain SoJaBio B1-5/56/2" /LENGTH=129 /DNA_ID=CAMNT_0047913763 /DNA_START=366 /DNA_END=755 /DNA_ORIENTATION=+
MSCCDRRNRPPLKTLLEEKAVDCMEVVGDFGSYMASFLPCVRETDRERYQKHHEDAWDTQTIEDFLDDSNEGRASSFELERSDDEDRSDSSSKLAPLQDYGSSKSDKSDEDFSQLHQEYGMEENPPVGL